MPAEVVDGLADGVAEGGDVEFPLPRRGLADGRSNPIQRDELALLIKQRRLEIRRAEIEDEDSAHGSYPRVAESGN